MYIPLSQHGGVDMTTERSHHQLYLAVIPESYDSPILDIYDLQHGSGIFEDEEAETILYSEAA